MARRAHSGFKGHEDQWSQRHDWSDAGEPEGLAYKVGVFEQVALEAVWKVETPTISGLARWQAWAEGEDSAGGPSSSPTSRASLGPEAGRWDRRIASV